MPEEKVPSGFRLSPLAKKRLRAMADDMDKSETQILEIAITHLLATLERDDPRVYLTGKDGPKRHKRPPDAA